MHAFASFNQQIFPVSKVFLPAASAAAFYGRGIFTTIAVYRSTPFQWAKHWRRLSENAAVVGIELEKFSENTVKNVLFEIIAKNKLEQGRARVTFFEESAGGIWSNESKNKTDLLIATGDLRRASENLKLTVSPYPVNSKSPLAGVKSSNYLENLLTLEEAGRRGFDEAIRLNETGEIASAATANVFWTRGGEIFTPALSTGALRGTTRDFLLENFKVIETRSKTSELTRADSIFLTSAGIGIAEVGSFENRKFEETNLFTKIQKRWKQALEQISD